MKAFIFIFLFTIPAFSQSFSSGSFSPVGINGSAGVGFVHFDMKSPNTQNVSLDQGTYLSVGGEKAFGGPLYLNLSLNYLKTNGQSMYNYTNANGNYKSNALLDFNANVFQAGLGLKFKLINNYWFRPYIAGGGLFGYFGINYKNMNSTTITGPDTNYKNADSIFDFGVYEEAGLEIAFSESFGMLFAFRYTQDHTQHFETLSNQEIRYNSEVYFISLLKKF